MPASVLPSSFKGSLKTPQLQRTMMRRCGLASMSRLWLAGVRNGIPEADAALAALIQGYADVAACQIGAVYAWRGEKDRAVRMAGACLRRQRDSGLVALRSEPVYDNLHGDPRLGCLSAFDGLADNQLK